MEFTLTPTNDLTIKAVTAKEVAEMCEHFRLDITKHTDQLVAGEMTYTVSGEKRPWFHLFADVPFEFLQPYYDLLKKITGYTGPAFEIAAPRYPGSRHVVNLQYTHIVVDAAIDATGYHAEVFLQAEDWNGELAAVRAPRNFDEYLREDLGARKHEPEFIRLGNGLLKENPKYLHRYPPHAALTSASLFEAIFNHWFREHATRAQVELWRAGEVAYRTVCKTGTLAASMLRNYSSEFHIENYRRTVTFAEFQAAGQKEPTL